MNEPHLLLVGALASDEDVVAGRVQARPGGAALFGAFAALAAGVKTHIWTPLAAQDQHLLQVLLEAGIGVHTSDSKQTSGIRNLYATPDRDRRTCQLLAQADPLKAEDMPLKDADLIHIAPLMAGEVPLEVLELAASRTELGLDAQGVLRCVEGEQLVFRDWADKRHGLSLLTYLKADAAEAEVMTGISDPAKAAMALHEMGPREVVVTRSDAVRLVAKGEHFQAPFTARSLEGRTGRGDTCMASYLARRLLGHTPESALAFAAALTSMKMETPGPFRGSPEQVLARQKADA